MKKIGIIGGSGFDNPQILKNVTELKVTTPYGAPSAALRLGEINGVKVVLIGRHGSHHQYSPSEVNYRANIFALKEQGVSHIIATTACGSLQEKIGRGHFVIIDQFIDFTKKRKNTFFESFAEGTRHTGMAEPFDPILRKLLYETALELGVPVHKEGTVITIEGPRFSTRAESKMFQKWGADIINMSVATEAILANEIGLPYAAIAMSTDYDCWKEDEQAVSWDDILDIFNKNIEKLIPLITNVLPKIK